MANRLKEEERMNGSYAAFLSCPTTADGLIAVVWIHSMFAPTSGCLCAPHAVEYRSYRPSRGRKPGEWLLFGGASASQAWNAPVAPNSLAPQGRVPSQSITNSTVGINPGGYTILRGVYTLPSCHVSLMESLQGALPTMQPAAGGPHPSNMGTPATSWGSKIS
ncbi:hypothetical protein MLD38_015012 [Melastoma candidum]|uniref:Uncharacterized protein n=1 Tax=Melastoma candidum TaxID=119954 RepID=A0ACB9RFA3_9MYRT|nr:hypothetical protein MLD38_015012 [Melastoma candidum]